MSVALSAVRDRTVFVCDDHDQLSISRVYAAAGGDRGAD